MFVCVFVCVCVCVIVCMFVCMCLQTVYNWQFVYCLKLWGLVLCEVSDSSLRPLLYPLVQIVIGTIQLQLSVRYHPLRLHLVRVLLQLADKTGTFIPVAPYLLEVGG